MNAQPDHESYPPLSRQDWRNLARLAQGALAAYETLDLPERHDNTPFFRTVVAFTERILGETFPPDRALQWDDEWQALGELARRAYNWRRFVEKVDYDQELAHVRNAGIVASYLARSARPVPQGDIDLACSAEQGVRKAEEHLHGLFWSPNRCAYDRRADPAGTRPRAIARIAAARRELAAVEQALSASLSSPPPG